jgi:hypothetical protein
MKGERFVEEQITRVSREAEPLDNVQEVGRQPNTADKTCITDADSTEARRACRVLTLHCSTKPWQSDTDKEREVVARIHALAKCYLRFTYRKILTFPLCCF